MPLPIVESGVRFECQQSGKCCTSRGSYGFVYVTLEDRRRLALHFGLTTSAFTRTYCSKTQGHFHLKHPELDCGFLDGKGCSVYGARPTQCRTWPFWPENMSPRAWASEVASFCPGVGKGHMFTPEEIQAILAESE
ncbi:MAG: YkgJ family cysteine cluster protein [Myxococcota bacterium]